MIIVRNAKAPKQNIQLLPTRRLLSPFLGVGRGLGGAEVHGKQKDDKIAL